MRSAQWFVSFLAVAAWFIVPATTQAVTNKTLGTYNTAGNAHDAIVAGNYAYVADDGDGVVVLNITNPSTPTLVTSFLVAGAQRLDLAGSRLYVASQTSGLTILDVSTPTAPSLLGSFVQTNLTVNDVATDGTYAYVLGTLNTQPTLEVLDVRTPSAISLVGSLAVTVDVKITLSGTHAYLVGGRTLDIADQYPALNLAGAYTDPSASADYRGVQVVGSVAYVNDPALGLHAINIANPAAPSGIFESATRFPGTGYGSGLATSNGYAFLSMATGGLAIYDIASAPQYIDTYSTAAAEGVTVANDVAFVAIGLAGLQTVDVSHPDVAPPVATPAGGGTIVVAPGVKFKDPGITTSESGLTTTVSGTVDVNRVGKYILTYTVTDRAGNKTTFKRTVIVGPSIEKLTLKNNTYGLKVGRRTITLTPFPGYRGALIGRRLIVDTRSNPFYVFIATDAIGRPALVMYNASGRLLNRQSLSLISTKGLQLDIAPNVVTLSIYFAIAPKANGLTATIYNVDKRGLTSLKTVTAAKGRGTLVMKWLKGYTNEYILATLVKGKTATPYVWRYISAKKMFLRDTKFSTRKLVWTTTSVALK